MILNRVESIESVENGYIVHGDTADALLIFMSDDIIRFRVSFDRCFPEESYTLVTTAWPDRMDELLKEERKRIKALDITCEDTGNALVFKTAHISLSLNKEPFYLTVYDLDGNIIYQDLKTRAYEKDYLGRLSHYSSIDPEYDHFYGFGESTGTLDKKGKRIRISPKDACGHDPEFGGPMYKNIPFYVRMNQKQKQAFGLFYHNSYDCVFDMGQELSGYYGSYSYYQTDGGDIDLFLLNGPKISEVIDHYTTLTGRTALPTKQSLGYCASTMYYAELDQNCDQEIYKVIDEYDRDDLPIDNFWLASGYSSGEEDNRRYVFNWNHKRFPDPEGFIHTMAAKGINVIPNLKPGILPRHPYYQHFKQNHAFIKTPDGKEDYRGYWWGGRGEFVDFTSPDGRNTWKDLLEEHILKLGVKTIWNDNCEMDGVADREAQCDFDGAKGSMAQLKIMQSNLMAYTARQAFHEVYPGERPYIINRAGFSGIQRYAQVWGGDNLTDWRTLKYDIATILGMGISGCANMGCDIGGFAGKAPDAELLVRWVQNGIFQPRFTMNSANSDNTVTQPFMYEEMTPYVKKAFDLRYQLLPYLYSLMFEASQDGMPAMRPLFMEFPDDENCYANTDSTFMFGPSILVANVVEHGAKTRTLYLPDGCDWYDMNDNLRQYRGGQTIEIPVTIESIPMFLRGSSVLVSTDDIKRIEFSEVKKLNVMISAEQDVEFRYYDDDGHTEQYLQGYYALTDIKVKAGSRTQISFHTEGSYQNAVTEICFSLLSPQKGAYWVALNGEKLPQYLIKDQLEKAECGWYYNLSRKTVEIKVTVSSPLNFELTVSTEKFDLINM